MVDRLDPVYLHEYHVDLGNIPLIFGWNSQFPDKIIIKKKVNVLALQLSAKAIYDTHLQSVYYKGSCKDRILGGRVTLDLQREEVGYRKRLSLGNALSMTLSAQCNYTGERKPSANIEFNFQHGSAVLADSVWLLKQSARIFGPIGVQARGGFKVPTPAAEMTLGSSSGMRPTWRTGAFHVFVNELNVKVEF